MVEKFSVLVIITAMFLFSAARADDLIAGKQHTGLDQSILKRVISVPVELDEAAKEVVVDKLTSLEEQRFIYLDLSIGHSPGGEDTASYGLTRNGKPQGARQNGCDIGVLPMSEGLVYELGPIADYNHLLMSIFTSDRSAFPYNDVSCEYVAGGDSTTFRVRGFFSCHNQLDPDGCLLAASPL